MFLGRDVAESYVPSAIARYAVREVSPNLTEFTCDAYHQPWNSCILVCDIVCDWTIYLFCLFS